MLHGCIRLMNYLSGVKHYVQNNLKFLFSLLFVLVKLYRFLKNYKSSTTLHNYSKHLSFSKIASKKTLSFTHTPNTKQIFSSLQSEFTICNAGKKIFYISNCKYLQVSMELYKIKMCSINIFTTHFNFFVPFKNENA